MLEKKQSFAGISFCYETKRLLLKLPSENDAQEILSFLYRNRTYFEKYEPTVPDNYYTLAFQHTLIQYELKLALKLSNIRFYVFQKEDPSFIIGTVCLHNITNAPYFTSEIGYKFDYNFWHQGYAKEALSKVLSIAFHTLNLHKVFARCMPQNVPSQKLLLSVGFFKEGIERDCILIGETWQDHIRYAILHPKE